MLRIGELKSEIEKFYYSNNPTFSELLFKFIEDKNLDKVECYKKALANRRLFSKIISNKNYKPLKLTVIKFIFALELNEDESEYLQKQQALVYILVILMK